MGDNLKDTLMMVHSYLERLIIGIGDLSGKLFNLGREGLNAIPDLAEGINLVVMALLKTHGEHSAEVDAVKVRDVMAELLDAVRNEDYTLINDLLTYELSPVLCGYYDALDEALFSNDRSPGLMLHSE